MTATCSITGSYTINPALTDDELEDLAVPHLDLVQEGENTTVTPEGECHAGAFELDLKALVRQIGADRVRGHVEVWGHEHGDVYRLGIVDGRVWAYYPQITWPED